MTSTIDVDTQKYVSLTTFKRDGTPKPLPVWIVGLPDGRLGFTTSSASWKAKRLANDPRVTLRPSDARGNVADGAPELTGTAVVVQGDEYEQVRRLIADKYGLMYKVMTAMSTVRGWVKRDGVSSDAAVMITLD